MLHKHLGRHNITVEWKAEVFSMSKTSKYVPRVSLRLWQSKETVLSLTEIENEPLGEPPFLLKLKQFKK